MREKSLKVNFVFNSILTITGFLFPMITFPYVSRILLPGGTGKISFVTSVIYYFNMIAQLGIPTYGIRACAKVRNCKAALSRTVQEILIINVLTTAAAYVCLTITVLTYPKFYQDKELYLIISLTIAFNMIGVEWLYKAMEQYVYITIRSVIFKALGILLMFILVRRESDYIIYGAVSIFAVSASNIFNFIHIRKMIIVRPVGGYEFKKHLKGIMIFFAMSVATTIYTHLDIVMLGIMTSDADVGYYNAAVRIKTILVGMVSSLGTVLLPRASFFIEHGMLKEFNRVTKKALHFVLILASSFTVYFTLFAKEGIWVLSGPAFSGSVRPMQIIMPTVFFIGLTNILGIQILVPLGKEKYVLYSEMAGALVNLIFNAVLIPVYASTGAAAGTLAAEFAVLCVQVWFLRKMVYRIMKEIYLYKIFSALMLSSVITALIKCIPMSSGFFMVMLSGVVFYTVYGGALLVMKDSFALEVFEQLIGLTKRKMRL